MMNDVKEILFSEEQINNRIKEIAKQLDEDYKGKVISFVGIIKGCIPFMTGIMMNTNLYCTMDFIKANSFHGGIKSTGNLKVTDEYDLDVSGKDVLLVEDIVDSGQTLKAVKEYLLNKGAKSVEIIAMLNKLTNRTVDIEVKYVGFDIPDVFVIGYGLDYQEKYRNLRCIATLDLEKLKIK